MGTRTIAVLVTVAFSVIGVVGDYFLKLASAREQPLRTGWFYLGFVLYASTAFGWVFVMRRLKLATISVLYSISMVLLLTAIGVVLFRDSPNENVNFTRIVREMCRNLLADKRPRQIADRQATVDRVVIGDCDEIHPALDQLRMQLPGIGIAVGEIEPPEQPLFGARTEAGVNV